MNGGIHMAIKNFDQLKEEVSIPAGSRRRVAAYWMLQGYAAHYDDPAPIARAYAAAALFRGHKKHIYYHDRIAGSIRGLCSDGPEISDSMLAHANGICASYGSRSFITNADHFAPDYETFLTDGISGTLAKIRRSALVHQNDGDAEKKQNFLKAAEIAMTAFSDMILQYAQAAADMAAQAEADWRNTDSTSIENLKEISRICKKISTERPETFREALQLVWLTHVAFLYEGRGAMALGRLDQYLYPFYRRDLDAGRLTRAEALALTACTLYKIGEMRLYVGDDVVNIAIGGRKPDGSGGLNELSYVILEAVKECGIPGPNLSARLYDGIPDDFIDACLQVIGTGIGYPALMNDEVNIPALTRHGYAVEDARNYCMVGCIENFMQGKQPPWSDGRYNTPKYIELALNNGRCMLTGVQRGPRTGDAADFTSMDQFMEALEAQMRFGAAEYMAVFRNENERYDRVRYSQPFLSCFCQCCIERALDINDGGAYYPSVHGAGCMGIATVADSLSAIDEVIFQKHTADLATLRDALAADFVGYEALHAALLAAPKYGNNMPAADKYAVWFVEVQNEIFSKYRTYDGGAIYTAIASNISNIPAGLEIAATPDGRKSRQPVSDAASPGHGLDKKGPTAVVQSLTKPDYTKVSCGTVLNQKYSPSMFTDPKKRARLLALIKIYFQRGGQEIQINSISRDILTDAMAHPDQYQDLVVRVSGFSAYYNSLSEEVKLDILERTEHA